MWNWIIPVAGMLFFPVTCTIYGWRELRKNPEQRRNLPNYFGEDARGP